jgi:tetratricopeptide (TPR) repeat protein
MESAAISGLSTSPKTGSKTLMQSIRSDDEFQACRSAILLAAAISRDEDAREQRLITLIETAGDRGSNVLLAAVEGYRWSPLPDFIVGRLLTIAWHDPVETVRTLAAEKLRHSSGEDALYQPIQDAMTEGRDEDVLRLIGSEDQDPFLPNDANLYWWRAVVLERLGRDVPAQRDAEKVASLGYDFVALRLLTARISERKGELAGAVSEAQQAVIIDPDSADAHTALGWYKLKLSQYDTAAKELSHAQYLEPRQAATHFNLGLALLATKQSQDANTAYHKGIERLEPETSQAVLRQAIDDLEELRPGEPGERQAIVELLRTHLSAAGRAAGHDQDATG